MPSYIDTKYVNILSSRLPLFKRKTNGLYNFRCPFCGDSQKSKTKARGYFYQKRTVLFFRCHNCGQSSTFSNFLKQFDGETYKEYALERYKEGITGKGHNTPDPKVEYKQPKFHSKIDLPRISDLDDDHFAKTYLLNRNIPLQFLNLIYYTDDFKTFVNKMTKREYDLSKNEQRLVIPFFDKDKQLITFQGRAFINTQLRYITIKMDEESSKIFGLERLDIKKKFYIVEGPFDSMFLPNCLAMAGSDVSFRGNDDIKEAMDNHKGTIIFDNEPRNKEIITRMEKVIDKGWNICIWPDSVACKDINDMIMTSINETKILEIINKNTFKNLHAKTHLAQWRKK
jgi:transcription elongation factor Elf1